MENMKDYGGPIFILLFRSFFYFVSDKFITESCGGRQEGALGGVKKMFLEIISDYSNNKLKNS